VAEGEESVGFLQFDSAPWRTGGVLACLKLRPSMRPVCSLSTRAYLVLYKATASLHVNV